MRKIDIILMSLFAILLVVFYRPVFLSGNVPIPTDTLVNLYHPFRDYYSAEYPRGVQYKNFLINDPITQQIPWRTLSIDQLKESKIPLWNPYAMAGYPLLGSIQSAPFYPLNVLLFFSFVPGWTIFIILQQIMAGIFMYMYLREQKILPQGAFIGGVAFAFSGFVISWLEWGTIVHTGLWLPLLLLAVDKLLSARKQIWWVLVACLALVFSYLAGHLQTWVYLVSFFVIYCLAKIYLSKNYFRNVVKLLTSFIISGLLLLPVIFTQVQLILLSARGVDLSWKNDGWFIPWQHLIQFIAPDFFGNPSTGNYWGIWNYGEFIGYIGIVPLLFAIYAIFFRRDKKTLFFAISGLVALFLALPTFFSKIPFLLQIPLLSSAQPTRLLFIVDFALSVLAALGVDYVLRKKKISVIPSFLLFSLLGLSFVVLYYFLKSGQVDAINFAVSRKNLIIPFGLVLVSSGLLLLQKITKFKYTLFISLMFFGVFSFDLLFFAQKYTPFADKAYYYPVTKTISFLKEQQGQFRIMATDRRILHPNIPGFYKIQTVDGYDPLYLQRYGELISASQRQKPDISSPFGFNRIIVPYVYDSQIINLLGVKYILSLSELPKDVRFEKVFEEGETKVYENKDVFPRAFFVKSVSNASSKQDAITLIMNKSINLRDTAIVEESEVDFSDKKFATGTAEIVFYTEDVVNIRTSSEQNGFLVLTDSFYPTWRATVDEKATEIYRTDFNFRGIVVPAGNHEVSFRNTFLSL